MGDIKAFADSTGLNLLEEGLRLQAKSVGKEMKRDDDLISTTDLNGGASTTDGGTRRVVCAAIRAHDGTLLLGIRHYSADMHRQIEQRMDGSKFKHLLDENQGFVDQHGVFMSRDEAYAIAHHAGQIVRYEACGDGLDGRRLYSEGLY